MASDGKTGNFTPILFLNLSLFQQQFLIQAFVVLVTSAAQLTRRNQQQLLLPLSLRITIHPAAKTIKQTSETPSFPKY